jgi:hypothetical protein
MAAVKMPRTNGTENIANRESAVARGIDPRRYDPDAIKIKARAHSIRTIIRKLHSEVCPPLLITAFRVYWPNLDMRMTMKEAWLRVVYMEAISGKPWASYFMAERDEGRVPESGHGGDDKGLILEAIHGMLKDPV